jgi:hypothetical protein
MKVAKIFYFVLLFIVIYIADTAGLLRNMAWYYKGLIIASAILLYFFVLAPVIEKIIAAKKSASK